MAFVGCRTGSQLRGGPQTSGDAHGKRAQRSSSSHRPERQPASTPRRRRQTRARGELAHGEHLASDPKMLGGAAGLHAHDNSGSARPGQTCPNSAASRPP